MVSTPKQPQNPKPSHLTHPRQPLPIPSSTPILIVGAGPAGLLLSLHLARNSIPSLLIERNQSTTKWPKMDITNVRSMELFRPNRLNIAAGLREIGVPGEFNMDVLFSSGLGGQGDVIARWDLKGADEMTRVIREVNDGGMPRAASQRASQAVVEAWLKTRVEDEALVTSFWGVKFEDLVEKEDGVVCTLVDVQTGEQHVVKAEYVAGCDGGGSRVRRCIGGEMIGGPVYVATAPLSVSTTSSFSTPQVSFFLPSLVPLQPPQSTQLTSNNSPAALYLVHFRSHDLTRLHAQGRFWHIFFTSGHVLISQNETDTWTVHTPIPLDQDIAQLDPHEAVYKALGGSGAPFHIEIDEVLVSSYWRPNVFCADKFSSRDKTGDEREVGVGTGGGGGGGGRVFLAGDAAHQMIPTGGYGMNTAVGDVFDLGWKLAATLHGYAGAYLLQSYEDERISAARKNLDRCAVHWSVQAAYWGMVAEKPGVVLQQDDEGKGLREKIRAHFAERDGENRDWGVEMGDRYRESRVVVWGGDDELEPEWRFRTYVPSTWPGARAPHVWLKDGKTSVLDLLGGGGEYTIVDFTAQGGFGTVFGRMAEEMGVPLKVVSLKGEEHVRKMWERDAVLVRPDDHVCWRAGVSQSSEGVDAKSVLKVVTGRERNQRAHGGEQKAVDDIKAKGFAGTVGNVKREDMEMLGDMQGREK